MKKLIFVLCLTGAWNTFAGLRFNHLVYVCQNDKGVEIHVLKPGIPESEKQDLKGQMMAYNKSKSQAPELGWWCSGRVKIGKNSMTIIEKELIAEDPSVCEFKLDTKKLTAQMSYKQWSGYVGGLSKPVIKNNEALRCEVRDEIVDY